MFAHKKVLQMRQKQLTHPPIQCKMHYKNNVLLRTCHLNYSIGNVSIVSYFAHKLLIILITNKTNPKSTLACLGFGGEVYNWCFNSTQPFSVQN